MSEWRRFYFSGVLSVTTMAVLMGVFPASQHFALSKYSVSAGGHDGIVHYDAAIGLPRSILRFVFGLAVVFTWRMAAKKLLYILLPPLYNYFNLPSRTHFVPAKYVSMFIPYYAPLSLVV